MAEIFRGHMIHICDSMVKSGENFSAMSDLSGLTVHSQDVAPIVAEGSGQMQRVQLKRYAMIVPMALMRLQVKRIHTGVNIEFFENSDDAKSWLGWRDGASNIFRRP